LYSTTILNYHSKIHFICLWFFIVNFIIREALLKGKLHKADLHLRVAFCKTNKNSYQHKKQLFQRLDSKLLGTWRWTIQILSLQQGFRGQNNSTFRRLTRWWKTCSILATARAPISARTVLSSSPWMSVAMKTRYSNIVTRTINI